MAGLYRHVPHSHIERRQQAGPVTVAGQHPSATAFQRFNAWLGLKVTLLVGTMVCAYIFGGVALLSLPSAITSHNLTIIIAWVSSNFIQLVLLPVIIVGQNVQASAADKRSEQTYLDAEAVLAEAMKIQEHLAAQDAILTTLNGSANAPQASARRGQA